MGAQFAKTAANGETVAEKPVDAGASPSKANGQVKSPGYISFVCFNESFTLSLAG